MGNTYTSVDLSGSTVTVNNGNTNTVFINGGSCTMTSGVCDLSVAPGTFDATISNMNPLSSDADDVTIARTITTAATVNSLSSVSNLGGGTVFLSGTNLLGVNAVTIAGCNADFTYASNDIHATVPVGCAGLASGATQLAVTADEATATLDLTVSVTGLGDYTLVETSNTIQFKV